MRAIPLSDLLARCAAAFPQGALSAGDATGLQAWWCDALDRAAPLAARLQDEPVERWTQLVLDHPAHRHGWYHLLADRVSVEEFAGFMLENRHFPAFLPLAARALEVQFLQTARDALQRNIADEQHPVPHADLMRRLMMALKARAGDGLRLEDYPELAERTLIFYHGFYRAPWALVGALYMTEAVALYRLAGMNRGLRRLGFDDHDREFVDLHMTCDEDHAREWIEEVIAPAIAANPALKAAIARGLAVALYTSERYLDRLVARAAPVGAGA
ncbi:iron-containing redox enzyme family protein [Novosphingobium rosa]|uniref:iron-containing redox enzyme family protein n=1 Tax=Novosphingobium rosa TaxID=76978 RepID=UPI00082B3552|nr:iron-containing redox enzyme family protein [Novosphingobium rosa]